MGTLLDLRKSFEATARTHLELLGFKRKKGLYVREVTDGMYYWIGLSISTYREYNRVSVMPNVGIFYKTLHAMVDRLTGSNDANEWICTVFTNVGYLMPRNSNVPVDFYPGEDIESNVRVMVSEIRNYGIPWMKELVDVDKLEHAMREYGAHVYNAYRIPCLRLLNGDKEAAIKIAAEFREKLKDDDRFLWEYDNFIQNVKDYNC